MDPLEDVLTLLKTRSHLSASLVAGGRWAVRFDAPRVVKFNAVRRGTCQLEVDGIDEPIDLAEGDCYLLTRPRSFTLRSDPETAPVDGGVVFARAEDGIARAGQGDDVFLIGGGFSFGTRAQELLLDRLPPIVHVPADTPHAETVQWALTAIDQELTHRPMASTLIAEHLAVIMLVHVLRLHLERAPHAVSGWLAGLADPVVATALTCLHRDPARSWTVADLADTAAVSRSTLAARFKATVGQGPLEYLTRWRIELAARQLREGNATLASIAHSVGYGSESALSVAFKRVLGMPPGDYRKHPTMP
ncbi:MULTISPECIES: AraC family transcriptional regulator [Streptomyces]|uniref:Putative AraC-like transcription regulator n=4 Tax=Streptomyces TaxID=1883 RepID=ARACL_STRLI|nr:MULTISPECIES: AraC family transcriptional regulator [Streptomyces]P35319.1 RecName: Full=Putative AraC-like transcription regulator [Streptomyces lividans]WOZ02934.1 AraC family transcriptional regulator [Streptomyces violaceoruber]BDD69597.1 AraC family transcriptional regulator [Streptomyces coelicolor]AAO61188.1 putative AraC-like activator [Streptomyces lividans 1326]EFD71905.1 probably a transcription activator [Streptomyces lividans TK24]KKD10329.1 AraC family transcriptional regulat